MINVTWTLPFVGPFATLGMMRAIFWAAGAEWSEPELFASLSLFIGVSVGGLLSSFLIVENKPLMIRKPWR